MTYLTELIHRNLVPETVIDSLGDVRICQLHDLMREVVLSKVEELSFVRTCPENLWSHNRVARYLPICNKSNKFPTTVGWRQTHSELEGAPLTNIPEELGNLLHLKYLSIRDTKSPQKDFSEVDLEAYSGSNFFHDLARLKQLRKLCITKLKSENGKDVCDAIEQMTHLQSLRISSIKEKELLQLHTITSLVFLRCLRL
ncbi:hypothetical protein GQ457_11G011220 [Hibiscus cannabinus]